MPEFLVTFERQVYEYSGAFIEADDEAHAREVAHRMLNERAGVTLPWHRGDVVNDSPEVRTVEEAKR